MTLAEQVQTQAKLMAPELAGENPAVVEAMSAVAVASLRGQLRENLGPEDCLSDFVSAAAMLVLAAMGEVGSLSQVSRFTAGDLTVQAVGGEGKAQCLRAQARALMQPYVKSAFVFMGV